MKSNLFSRRGFTLVELLVVISIMGFLSSIVINSLNSARSKGSDASVKQTMNNVRGQANIVYLDNSSSYSSVCSDPRVVEAIAQIKVNNGTVTPICYNDATRWVLASPLKGGGFWCVDSTNAARSKNGTSPFTTYNGLVTTAAPSPTAPAITLTLPAATPTTYNCN